MTGVLRVQVPAVLAVLQVARTHGLLDDLDPVVASSAPVSNSINCCGADGRAGSSGAGSGSVEGGADNNYGGGSGEVRVPLSLLEGAITSSSEHLRLDALQLVTGNPRMTSLPGALHGVVP